jgi:hypothetical protein
MITLRHLPILAAAGALLALFGWASSLDARNARLTEQLASAERETGVLQTQLDNAWRAAQIEARRREEWQARATKLSSQIEILLTGDIPDAPLDPALYDLLDRLRGDHD